MDTDFNPENMSSLTKNKRDHRYDPFVIIEIMLLLLSLMDKNQTYADKNALIAIDKSQKKVTKHTLQQWRTKIYNIWQMFLVRGTWDKQI